MALVLVFLLPQVEGGLADAHLSAHLIDRAAQLGLLESKRYLLLCELTLLHDMTSFPSSEKSCRKKLFHSVNNWFEILGQGHS